MAGSQLAGRWLEPEGLARAAAVLNGWQSGGDLAGLGLGTVDGRIDLRGFQLPPDRQVGTAQVGGVSVGVLAEPRPRIIGAQLTGLDLSGARLQGITFGSCRLEDVVADAASFDGVGLVWSDVVGSSFRRVRWRNGSLAIGAPPADDPGAGSRRTTYVDCDFGRARIDGALCEFASFLRCTFEAAVLHDVDFRVCDIRDCAMAATLRTVEFTSIPLGDPPDDGSGAPMTTLSAVDFSGGRFEDVTIRRVALEDVRWPMANRYVRLQGDVRGFLEWAGPRLDRFGPTLATTYVEQSRAAILPDQADWIVTTDDFAGSRDRREHELELAGERQLMELAAEYGPGVAAAVHEGA